MTAPIPREFADMDGTWGQAEMPEQPEPDAAEGGESS